MPSLNRSVGQPKPMRKWSGISKKRPGTIGGVVTLAKQGIERVGVAAGPARKGDDAVLGGHAVEVVAGGEEGVGSARLRWSIAGVSPSTSSSRVEGDAGQALGLMRLGDAEQVVEPPDPLGQRGLGKDPAAAEAAEAIDLGQAVGADELGAESGRRFAAAGRRSRDRLRRSGCGRRPRGELGDARRSSSSARLPVGLWRLVRTMRRVRSLIAAATLSGSSAKAGLGVAFEPLDLGAEEARGAEQRLIGRHARSATSSPGRDQRGHREHVGHRGAVGQRRPVGRHTVACGRSRRAAAGTR